MWNRTQRRIKIEQKTERNRTGSNGSPKIGTLSETGANHQHPPPNPYDTLEIELAGAPFDSTEGRTETGTRRPSRSQAPTSSTLDSPHPLDPPAGSGPGRTPAQRRVAE